MDATAASELVTSAARLVRHIRRLHDVPAGVRILAILDETGPLGISALAEADHCSQPTMSNAVAALVEGGQLAKASHPTDRRSSVVTLTAAGRAELARVRRLYGATVAARLAATTHSPDDVATAVAVLRDVIGADPITRTAQKAGSEA